MYGLGCLQSCVNFNVIQVGAYETISVIDFQPFAALICLYHLSIAGTDSLDCFGGIDSGQTLQMEGQGGAAAAKEGTPGNLFVEISVAGDKVLSRRGSNIHVTIDVDFIDAILGSDAK